MLVKLLLQSRRVKLASQGRLFLNSFEISKAGSNLKITDRD